MDTLHRSCPKPKGTGNLHFRCKANLLKIVNFLLSCRRYTMDSTMATTSVNDDDGFIQSKSKNRKRKQPSMDTSDISNPSTKRPHFKPVKVVSDSVSPNAKVSVLSSESAKSKCRQYCQCHF